MAFPKLGTERARPDISEALEEYDLAMNMNKFVAGRLLPIRNVELAHGTYPAIELKQLMKNNLATTVTGAGKGLTRAPTGGYARDDFTFTERAYSTVEYGFEARVDERESAHYASYFDHEVVSAVWARYRLLLEQERRVAGEAFSTTRFAGQTADAAVPWSTPATADPILDFRLAKFAVFDLFGQWPDSAIMNRHAFTYLRETDQIRARITGQGAGDPDRQRLITTSQVADVLDLEEIIIAEAVEDTAGPNAAFAAAEVWGASSLLFKRANSIRDPGLGHILHWGRDGSMPNGFVEDYYEIQNRTQIVRVRHQVQELWKMNLGYLLTTVYE